MSIQLRDYQLESEANLRSFFSKNPTGKVILDGRTGTGKTVTFISIAKQAIAKGKKPLILSHRTELMNQAGGAFEKQGISPFYLSPDVKKLDNNWPAVSGMMQTLRRRIDQPDTIDFIKSRDLIIADEIHDSTIDFIFDTGLVDDIPMIGATATALRTGGQRQLGMMWDDIVRGKQVRYFVEKGWLMPDRYFGVSAGDVSNVKYDNSLGDYNPYAMYKHFDKREMYAGVIDNYRTHADKTKAMTFCTNQAHAIKTAVEFDKAGISTMFLVSGKSEPKKPLEWENEAQRIKYEQDLELYMLLKQYSHLTGKRSDILSSFKANRYLNLVNVNMLTTGVDVPDVVSIIINRYTVSIPLYWQIVGRGSRISPETGKTHFNIFDFGDAAYRDENRLGRYMDDRQWGLWHDKSKGGGVAGTKLCDKNKEDKFKRRGCNRLVHIGAKMCKCGFVFATEKELKEAELKEIAYGDEVPEEVLISTMNAKQLKAHAKLKGYKFFWIPRVMFNMAGNDAVKLAMKENANLTEDQINHIRNEAGKKAVYAGLRELGYKHYYIREYVLKRIA